MSNNQPTGNSSVSKEALINADAAVRTISQRLKLEQKNHSQLTKLLAIKQAQADVFKRLSAIQQTREALPDFLSSREEIETAQSSNLDTVVQKARGALLSLQKNRLQRQLKVKGVDTTDLTGAQQQAKRKVEVNQGALNDRRDEQQTLRQQKRTQVLADYQTRQDGIEKIRSASEQGLDLAGKAFTIGKNLFAPGMEFEKQMSDVQAQLGLEHNDPSLSALRQQATGMASEGYSARDVAQAQSTLAKAGLSPQEVLAATPDAMRNGENPPPSAPQTMVNIKGDNLDSDIKKLFANWENIRIELFAGQSDSLQTLTQTATRWLDTMGQWLRDNPALANTLLLVGTGLTTLVGGLGAIGTFIAPTLSAINMLITGAGLLGTTFTTIGGVIGGAFAALSLPVLAVAAAIVGGAALIYKYWQPISAFIGGVAEGIIGVIMPIIEGFSPLTAIFDTVIGLVKRVFASLKELLAPVKMTQEGLNQATDYGKTFGEVLATVLTAPIRLFAELSKGIAWLLEKLGLLKTTSATLAKTDPNAKPADLPPGIGAPAMPLKNYQPTMVPGVTSTANNKTITNHLTINTTPGMDRQEVNQMMRDIQQSSQWERENMSYSSYLNQ